MLIEGKLLWGEDLLAVVHVAPRERVCVADFGLPIPGDDQLIVAALEAGETRVVHPCVAREGVVLHVRLVEEGTRLPWSFGDLRVAQGVLLGAILHLTFLLMTFLVRATPTEIEAAAFADMQARSMALDAREHATDVVESSDAELHHDVPGSTAKTGPEGAMGKIASTRDTGLARRTRGAPPAEPIDRRRAEAAHAFGMIGIITIAGGSSGKSAFADDDGPSAQGSIFGTTIDDAMGVGGAALSGWGEGGGGLGAGIPLQPGGLGRCGVDCYGERSAYGRAAGAGHLKRGHEVKSPVLRCGSPDPQTGREQCTVQVNGRLPPEAIQRIVRQHFGRLRGCYESGLRRNPSLEGRVAVKFVIDREGAVSMASAGENDLPDQEVVSCVVRGFQAMSFPPPTGGIVTVVYPITFSS